MSASGTSMALTQKVCLKALLPLLHFADSVGHVRPCLYNSQIAP
jgi:hypothetical protein